MKNLWSILGSPVYAQGSGWSSRCLGGPNNDVATLQGFECVFERILTVAASLAGLAFGVMIVAGGFKLITAGGDKQKIQQAQKTLTYAFLGMLMIIVSWLILLLIENFTGIQVTEFNIPS